jgi:hypothetical protein
VRYHLACISCRSNDRISFFLRGINNGLHRCRRVWYVIPEMCRGTTPIDESAITYHTSLQENIAGSRPGARVKGYFSLAAWSIADGEKSISEMQLLTLSLFHATG